MVSAHDLLLAHFTQASDFFRFMWLLIEAFDAILELPIMAVLQSSAEA